MKSLYFIGNEELWNDAWFQALVESLKSRSVNVSLLDSVTDAAEIKTHAEKLSVYERMIFYKGMDPESFAQKCGIVFTRDKLSLVYIFSDIVNPSADPKQVAWGADKEEFLKNVGMWEGSQIIEDAFLFEQNIAGEVSKAMEVDNLSLVNSDLLSADMNELEKMIEVQSLNSEEDKKELKEESPLDLGGASELLDEAFDLAASPEENNKTLLIKPVELSEAEIPLVSAVVAKPELGSQFSDESKPVVAGAAIEVSQLLSSMSHSVTGEDIEVLKRYSSIKERELRESQASVEALRRQIRYFDERLKKSEEERRRLLLKLEETDNELRTVADKKDENKAQLRSIESRYEEKIKELLAQLESSQFQAGKLEKKLIDFKERVRNDLQKIRSRERELASRLEIQKRDAEALLSAKDERLLNQKREMDRLEFDMDSLKERLMDDSQKNEEKRKRVARALQSLKLAQSILSGLEEDIVTKDDKDKAA